jgi:hypothetical protein
MAGKPRRRNNAIATIAITSIDKIWIKMLCSIMALAPRQKSVEREIKRFLNTTVKQQATNNYRKIFIGTVFANKLTISCNVLE